jgi:hypothetical protein
MSPKGVTVIAGPRTEELGVMDVSEVRPFRVEISGAAIDDLRERLARMRWPEKEPVEDWSMGIPLMYVQELAAYSRFPADNVALSERWARTRYTDLRYYGTPAHGGHFAAYEAPGEFVTEVRAGLRALSPASSHA